MSYRLEIGLALLLATAIGIAVWAADRTPKATAYDPRASTFLSGPEGSKALHDVLLRLGKPSVRRRTALFTLAEDPARRPGLLVVVNPFFPLQDAELAQVMRFVRGGGAVLAAGRGGGITRCAGWRLQPDRLRDDSITVLSPPGRESLRLPRAARWLEPRGPAEVAARIEDLIKGDGEDGIQASCRTLLPLAVDTILAAVESRPVIVRLRYRGGGTITLAADAGWFTNKAWRDSDVASVVMPLLTFQGPQSPTAPIVWDEYHQGFGTRSATSLTSRTWSWLRESPAGWAIFQLIAVALIWLAVTAVRFGPARSVIERRRRSPLEHLEALSAGLESAADADTAVQRLTLGLRRRLSRAGQTEDGGGTVLPWLDSLELAVRGADGRAAVRRLRNLVTHPDRTAGANRVLQTAQAVEDVWEQLRPRTTRNAS